MYTLSYQPIVIAALSLAVSLLQAETVYELEEYTVTAWHFEREVLDVPADVIRVDRVAIDESLAASVTELLESEANLYFSTLSGSTNVDIRGFGENSGLRTLVLIDGQPLNPGDMGRINWELIPLDAIESIEVLKGGQNVLYGDKALSGVIKIETRRSGESGISLDGRLGSFGSSRASISGGVGAGNWSFRASASRSESDGYREHSQSAGREAFVSAGYSFSNGDNLDVRLSLAETDQTYPGGLSYDEFRSDARSSNKTGIEGAQSSLATLTARAEGSRDWGDWELLAGYDYSQLDFVFEPLDLGSNEQDGFSLKPRIKLGQENVFILGSDWLYDRLEYTDYLDEARSLIPAEAEVDEWRIAPYFLVERQLSERMIFSAGARYEWVRYEVDASAYDRSQLSPVIETNRGTFPNPNYKNPPDRIADGTFAATVREEGAAAELSVNYRLSEQWSAFAGYDRVYRYPVFDERGAYQGFPLAEDVSPLEAEEGNSYELGTKYIEQRHEFYLTGFFLQMENEIFYDSTVQGSNAGIKGLNVNLGPVDRYGLDVLYRYHQEAWGFSFQVAHVATEMKSGIGSGQEVPLAPRFVTTGQVWWEPVDWLRLRLLHRYVSQRYQGSDLANTQRKIEAYHLVDLSTEARVSENCRVFFKVDNVFDQLYAETAVPGAYYPGAGRSFEIGLKLDF